MGKFMSDPMRRLVKGTALLLVLFAFYISLSSWLSNVDTFPIKYVRIEGDLKHVSKESVSAASSTLLETGFFALNTNGITEKLEHIEWVKSARVSRVWPDTVSLKIIEQQPVAIWNKQFLLNGKGEIFKPKMKEIRGVLPSLAGDDMKSAQLYASFKQINNGLSEMGVSINTLSETNYGSWSAETVSGVQIEAGNIDPFKKIVTGIKLLTLAKMDVLSRIKKVDMRYPNGVSVIWKEGESLNNTSTNNAAKQLIKS